MSDDLRELIARVCNQPTPLQTADAILAALDAAGWTISRKMVFPDFSAEAVECSDEVKAHFRALLGLPQQTPATPDPGSVPAGEADTPTEGETGSQQREDM